MSMQLEGDRSFERVQTRRWVSIVAFVIPVAAFVLLGAWFVRVYIIPPTVNIPNLIAMATAPPTPLAPPTIEPMQAPIVQAAPAAQIEPSPAAPSQMAQSQMAKSPMAKAVPAATERRESAPSMPMFATLAVVPPAINGAAPPAFADPARDVPAVSVATPEPAALEASEPIAGPIPLPHARPHGRVALVTGDIPLPRPRPVDNTPVPNDLPAVDRHAVD